MPLSASVLSASIKSKLLANPDSMAQTGNADALQALCDEIAAAVVEHIVSAALVTVTVTTTGTAAAQASGGTGTIT